MASNDWKKKNYNSSVKVSSSTIADLKAGKTFEGNVAKFKSGATTEQREAMNRFYGKARVDSALGSSVSTVNKTYPGTTKGGTPGVISGKTKSSYKAPSAPKTSAPKSGGSTVGNFVKNELLGVDDFSSMVSHLKKREFKKAALSAATGASELGSTAGAIGASAFTGGAAGTAYVAAKVGARQVGKQVVKQSGKHATKAGVKAVASKAGLGAAKGASNVVKTVATGSIKTGAKNVAKAPGAAVRAVKSGTGAVKQASKISPSSVGKFVPAAQKARAATAEVKGATKAYRTVKSSAKSTGNLKSNVKGLGAAYDAMSGAKNTSKAARGELNAIRKEMAKKAAKGKAARRAMRRVQAGHATASGTAYVNRRGN